MAKSLPAPKFSPEIVKAIAGSLPAPISKSDRELLMKILADWGPNELRRHLSMPSRAIVSGRLKKIATVKRRAGELLKALDSIDEAVEASFFSRIFPDREGRGGADFADQAKRFKEAREIIAKIAGMPPRKLPPNHRRNLAAYLVLRDAAAIFEWLTESPATRQVDRINGTETGAFFGFVSILWPAIFGKGAMGLSAAMKNWASLRSRYDEPLPLIIKHRPTPSDMGDIRALTLQTLHVTDREVGPK